MSNFFPELEKEFSIDDQNTVTVKMLTFEERMRASSRALASSGGDTGAAYVLHRLEMTKLAVKAWAGPGFEGVPCTPENIAKLDTDIGRRIADFVLDFNVPAEDAEEKKA